MRPNIFIKCKISPSTKQRVMKKWLRRFLKYIRNPSNEFGFMVLSLMKKWTNLPANIFIDDGGLWTNIGRKRIILFQADNSGFRDFDRTLPMSVEDEPEVLIKNEKIGLSDSELEQVRGFIRKNRKELIQLAEGKIDSADFFKATAI